jgi:hypothetical protein
MADILKFRPKNAAIDPDVVLEEARGDFESLCVIGWDKSGQLDARATLNLGHAELYWLVSLFRNKLINGDYADDNESE